MYLLDTNVISEAMRPNPEARVMHWLIEANPEVVFLSVIVKAELLFGIEILEPGKRRTHYANYVQDFFGRCPDSNLLDFRSVEAALFATIATRRRSIGRPMMEMDALIAATAVARGLTVVTRNVRDFEDCGVALLDPWDPSS
jgi:toxin FitB